MYNEHSNGRLLFDRILSILDERLIAVVEKTWVCINVLMDLILAITWILVTVKCWIWETESRIFDHKNKYCVDNAPKIIIYKHVISLLRLLTNTNLWISISFDVYIYIYSIFSRRWNINIIMTQRSLWMLRWTPARPDLDALTSSIVADFACRWLTVLSTVT